jgi:hypothetical protein
MTTLEQGQVIRFMENIIRASVILEHMVTKMDKFRQHTREMKEALNAPMHRHRFMYMHMCEDIFSKWVDYDKENPLI